MRKPDACGLSPEFIRTTTEIEKYILEIADQPICDQFADKTSTTGTKQKLKATFRSRDIPGGDIWTWNQTKRKQATFLPTADCEITIAKMIPRRKRNIPKDTKVPAFKLWKVNVKPNNGSGEYSILYCEKGFSADLCISELYFLHKFMDPLVANQLWPQNSNYLC